MKKSITIATMLVVGAGATGASAAVLNAPYQGSDTLFNVTRQAITNIGTIGPATAYIGGGSGNGQSAMAVGGAAVATATQQTAPMSRMINSGGSACIFNGGTAGSADTHASGIVVGLDAVDVLSNKLSGAQQIAACNLLPNGAAASGTTGVFGGGTQNWKWVLALVYGGADLSTGGVVDCNSTARKNLVNNWGKLIQGEACTLSTDTHPTGSGLSASAACTDATHLNAGDGVHMPLWHAFRRDEASGTSDVFSSLIGISPATSNSSLNGFGASPYCNALNWDTKGQGAGTFNDNCAYGGHDQWTGPGGVKDPLSTVVTATGAVGAPGTGDHRRPPPGTWGDNPDPNQTTNSADVLPTQMQDNDPIRRPCIGGATGVHARAGEEVCNIDNALGLVLPMVDSDWMLSLPAPNNRQYPTNPCTASEAGKAVTVFSCAIRGTGTKHSGECPNGDALNAGSCAVPTDEITVPNTSQCLSTASTHVLSVRTTLGNSYGRAYNVQMRDGTTTGAIGYAQYPVPATNPPSTQDYAGAYNRIHQQETILADAAPGCQMVDMTDQIGCLVAEDPCSIGYSGDGSKTWSARPNGFTGTTTDPAGTWDVDALNIGGAGQAVAANQTNVQKLGTKGEYQFARKLYLNTLVGFANVAVSAGDPGAAAEITLADNEASPAFMNAILTPLSFFPLGAQVTSAAGNLCEDFNEQTVCGAAANVNGCLGNPAPIPGAAANSSVVCGDNVVGPFEECDGLVNAGSGCTATCRCKLDYNQTTGVCN